MYKVSELKQILSYHVGRDPSVFALVEDRVYTAHGKDTEEASRQSPLVIFDFRGGLTQKSAPVARRTFHVYAYSNRSGHEAGRLYEHVAEVLRLEGLGAPPDENGDPCFAQCGYFIEADAQVEGWSSVTSSWWVRGTWQGWTFG